MKRTAPRTYCAYRRYLRPRHCSLAPGIPQPPGKREERQGSLQRQGLSVTRND